MTAPPVRLAPETSPDLPQWQHEAISKRVTLISAAIVKEAIPTLRSLDSFKRQGPSRKTGTDERKVESESATNTLTGLLLEHDAEAAHKFVMDLYKSRHALSSIYNDLLGPVARRLGDLWLEDKCSFVDVTLGLGVLHRLVLDLRSHLPVPQTSGAISKKILLTISPGDDHRFGMALVAEQLSRSGWAVTRADVQSADEVVSAVRAGDFRIVGFSAGSRESYVNLLHIVETLREQVQCDGGGLIILAGGPIFIADPSLGSNIGVDAICGSSEEAIEFADFFHQSRLLL